MIKQLIEDWKQQTCGLSSIYKKVTHPLYKQIMQSQKDIALLCILEDMQRQPNHWFVALKHLTSEDPAKDCISFEEAAQSWVEWGIRKGILCSTTK